MQIALFIGQISIRSSWKVQGVSGKLIKALRQQHATQAVVSQRKAQRFMVSELMSGMNEHIAAPLSRHSTMEEVKSSESDGRCVWRTQWDIAGTVAWIVSRGFSRVTLQFPDELLQESTVVAAALQKECAIRDIPAQAR